MAERLSLEIAFKNKLKVHLKTKQAKLNHRRLIIYYTLFVLHLALCMQTASSAAMNDQSC